MGCFMSLGCRDCSVHRCNVCSECCALCLNCAASSSRCCFDGRMLCCVFLSLVHPVAMRSAVFCMVCSLFVRVSDIMGDYMVLPYSSVVPIMAVYVFSNVSFDLPQCEVVSDVICLVFSC